jgi:hypothetical protein
VLLDPGARQDRVNSDGGTKYRRFNAGLRQLCGNLRFFHHWRGFPIQLRQGQSAVGIIGLSGASLRELELHGSAAFDDEFDRMDGQSLGEKPLGQKQNECVDTKSKCSEWDG